MGQAAVLSGLIGLTGPLAIVLKPPPVTWLGLISANIGYFISAPFLRRYPHAIHLGLDDAVVACAAARAGPEGEEEVGQAAHSDHDRLRGRAVQRLRVSHRRHAEADRDPGARWSRQDPVRSLRGTQTFSNR